MADDYEYICEEKLGEGGFGNAYLIKCVSDDSRYVLKEQPGQPLRQIIISEVEQLKRISHPCIMRYHHYWYIDEKWWIGTEYATGGTLKDAIRRADRPISSPLFCFAQIILGVHHIHKKKILHRNLKPNNILLQPYKSRYLAKIGDFGIAKNSDKPLALIPIGTRLYVAPEVLQKKPYDCKSDIWSVGMILYELLTNTYPFETSSYLQMLHQISCVNVKPLPNTIPSQMMEMTYSILQKNPESRPSAEDLVLSSKLFTTIKYFYQWLSVEDQIRLLHSGSFPEIDFFIKLVDSG